MDAIGLSEGCADGGDGIAGQFLDGEYLYLNFVGLANVIYRMDMEGTNMMAGMSGMKSGGEGMEFVGGRDRDG